VSDDNEKLKGGWQRDPETALHTVDGVEVSTQCWETLKGRRMLTAVTCQKHRLTVALFGDPTLPTPATREQAEHEISCLLQSFMKAVGSAYGVEMQAERVDLRRAMRGKLPPGLLEAILDSEPEGGVH